MVKKANLSFKETLFVMATLPYELGHKIWYVVPFF